MSIELVAHSVYEYFLLYIHLFAKNHLNIIHSFKQEQPQVQEHLSECPMNTTYSLQRSPATSLPSGGLSRCAMCCLTGWSMGKQWAVHTSFYIRRDWQKAAQCLLTHRLFLQLPATHYLYHPTHCTPHHSET